MISDIFKRDYKRMSAEGVSFTVEDIVRLNALAVKVKLSATAAETVALPRVAFLGDLTLREPTLAHDLWLEEASRFLDLSNDTNFLFLYAYALARPANELADVFKPKRVIDAVFSFAAKNLVRFTRTQLKGAVEYALFGNDWKAGEHGPADKKKGDTPKSPAIGLIVNARALRLPITLEDTARMTARELEESVSRALILDGETRLAQLRERALAEYVRAREEVRNRT